MSGRDVVIVSAVRTPIGSFCGSLSSLKASDLGSVVIKECLKRANVEASDISEVILGQVLTAGQGQNPARQAAVKAGLPISVPAYLVNMLCGSGLKAVVNGYISIKTGDNDIVIAGGQESMSQAPHIMQLRNGTKMGNATLDDSMLSDGLTDAFIDAHMGITAENIAKKFKIGREEQDAYAAKSQQRAQSAIAAGYFQREIVPVIVPGKRGSITISTDEFPKRDTTADELAKLRPIFIKTEGTVTAGNSSGINDGAAAVLLMSAELAIAKGIAPIARIVAAAQTGVEPEIMGIGPITAIELVLKKAKWRKDEVDLYELNEAFAVQAVACSQTLGLDATKVNVNGGAIALGHPIGASGARVLVTLLHLMERRKEKRGVASLCIGGGMGIAIAVEKL